MDIKVKVLNITDENEFSRELEKYLNDGYELKSCNIGFVNSEQYDFCSSHQAILVRNQRINYKKHLKYIDYAGDPSIKWFDDDWEPVGPKIRKNLVDYGWAEEGNGGKIWLTELGRKQLKTPCTPS